MSAIEQMIDDPTKHQYNDTLADEARAEFAELLKDNESLRAQVDRMRTRRNEIDDEAFEYAEEIERLKAELAELREDARLGKAVTEQWDRYYRDEITGEECLAQIEDLIQNKRAKEEGIQG